MRSQSGKARFSYINPSLFPQAKESKGVICMKKRLLALLLTLTMMVSALPVQAFAAEDPIALPEAELAEGVAESGHFYLASNTAELREEGSGR